MKLRNKIDDKYKWNFDNYDLEKAEKVAIDNIQFLIDNVPKYDGKLNDADTLFEFLTMSDEKEKEIGIYVHYLHNQYNADNSDVKTIQMMNRLENQLQKLNEVSSFVHPQLLNLSDKFLHSLLKDERFKNYDNMILDLIKDKPHKIDEKTSKIISKMGNFIGKNSKIFKIITDSEMDFAPVKDSAGKEYIVDNASCPVLLTSKDKTLRSNTYTSMLNGYGKLNKTFANLYLNDIETDKTMCAFHNYKSVLEESLDEDDIPLGVLNNIIWKTNDNLNLLHDYVKAFKKYHKIDKMEYSDLMMDTRVEGKINLAQAEKLILSALSPLGRDYVKLVEKKLKDGSIDFMPNKNKYSGAYCSNRYGAKTLVLMNFNNNYDSVSTLIHEMGHCINAELFNANQPYQKADITIFLAEIASTVNELLLNQYMQKHSKNKGYYIGQFLNDVRATIYSQILYSEFELYAHTQIEKDKPLTHEDLNNYWYNLHKKYYGKTCILPKCTQYGWSRIPHFYTAYYVYAYATGMITAINIVSKILKDEKYSKAYIEFLKNGTNKKPMDILKEIGIDLTSEEPYDVAFKFIRNQLSEYKKLAEKTK